MNQTYAVFKVLLTDVPTNGGILPKGTEFQVSNFGGYNETHDKLNTFKNTQKNDSYMFFFKESKT